MNDNGNSISELPVPKFKRVVVGVGILTAFILFFVFLAIYNLRNRMGIIPSTIWLLLVGFVFAGFIKTNGWKKSFTDILGAFSRNEFVRTVRRENAETDFQYGYKIFGKWFSYFTVGLKKIETVEWSTGQASHFAGRDMNDWQVVVWYDHGDSFKSQKKHMLKKPDKDLFIIGMSSAKLETAALGCSVLDLLRRAGATFIQGKNDCSFIRDSFTSIEK